LVALNQEVIHTITIDIASLPRKEIGANIFSPCFISI